MTNILQINELEGTRDSFLALQLDLEILINARRSQEDRPCCACGNSEMKDCFAPTAGDGRVILYRCSALRCPRSSLRMLAMSARVDMEQYQEWNNNREWFKWYSSEKFRRPNIDDKSADLDSRDEEQVPKTSRRRSGAWPRIASLPAAQRPRIWWR